MQKFFTCMFSIIQPEYLNVPENTKISVLCSQFKSTCNQELEIKLSFGKKKFRYVWAIICLMAGL